MQKIGEKLKCINLIEVIDEGNTEFKDKEGHSYHNARKFRKGGNPLETQTQ